MILIVTNSRDLAVDEIVTALRTREEAHVRLDLDLLDTDRVVLDPLGLTLRQQLPDGDVRETECPRAILWRAPTHLRESSGHRYEPAELLSKHQWAAFARSLMVFRSAKWINHPAATFAAENKPYQLALAFELGLDVPRTAVGNHLSVGLAQEPAVAVKALDTFLLRAEREDLFFYTTSVPPQELTDDVCLEMPVIFQELCEPKHDVRVTVVGQKCFAARSRDVVSGDWRRLGKKVEFEAVTLPPGIEEKCIVLLRKMGLCYGAIDFAEVMDKYHFLEVNPTGEWGWIDHLFDGAIASALTDALVLTETCE